MAWQILFFPCKRFIPTLNIPTLAFDMQQDEFQQTFADMSNGCVLLPKFPDAIPELVFFACL
jgi:hypothetical protein